MGWTPFRKALHSATMEDGCEHEEGSSLTNEEQMKIYLKVTKTIALGVNYSDTIEDVKHKFSNMEGVPSNTQVLFYAGNHLKNKEKLVDCDIRNGSTIQVFLRPEAVMCIYIKAPWIGDIIVLDVNNADTIHNIKVMIQEKAGILAKQLALIYIGKELKDTKNLAGYNIQSGSTLYAAIRSANINSIFVRINKQETIELEVKLWHTVEYVKTMIESVVLIPTDQQWLKFNGKHLENGSTLSHYGIQEGSTVNMVLPMQILVQTLEGKKINLGMPRSIAIGAVKKKIHEREKILAESQILSFNNKQLENHRTLEEYNVQEGSTLQLVFKMQIFVKSLKGKSITFEVLSSDTVYDVMCKIHDKEGIQVERQKLTYEGKRLDCSRTLEYFNIQKDSTLYLGVNPPSLPDSTQV